MNLMVIINQKPLKDVHTHTHKKERNPNITLKRVIKSREESKRKKEQKRTIKTTRKQ